MTQPHRPFVRARVPAQRAQGLDPEITAQPRTFDDEIALEASAEPDLTVDPDDLGSRFLREATEQGDFSPERTWPVESGLYETPVRDQPLDSANFPADSSIWEQTVELETRAQGAAASLREPPPPTAAEFAAAFRETEPDPIDVRDASPRVRESRSRGFSFSLSRDSLSAALRRSAQALRHLAGRMQQRRS